MNDLLKTMERIGKVYDYRGKMIPPSDGSGSIDSYSWEWGGRSIFVEEGGVSYTYTDEGIDEESIDVHIHFFEKDANGNKAELKLEGQVALDYFGGTGQWAEWVWEWWH